MNERENKTYLRIFNVVFINDDVYKIMFRASSEKDPITTKFEQIDTKLLTLRHVVQDVTRLNEAHGHVVQDVTRLNEAQVLVLRALDTHTRGLQELDNDVKSCREVINNIRVYLLEEIHEKSRNHVKEIKKLKKEINYLHREMDNMYAQFGAANINPIYREEIYHDNASHAMLDDDNLHVNPAERR